MTGTGRQEDKLKALVGQLGERAHYAVCDLADKTQVSSLIDEAVGKMGGIDILVNNAGLTRDNLFMVMKDDQWNDVISVNLTSTFMLMRNASRSMMRAKTGYGAHHQHLIGKRHNRQSGAGQLCSCKSWHDRHDQIAGA